MRSVSLTLGAPKRGASDFQRLSLSAADLLALAVEDERSLLNARIDVLPTARMTSVRITSVVYLHDAVAVASIADDIFHIGFAGGNSEKQLRRELVILGGLLKMGKPSPRLCRL